MALLACDNNETRNYFKNKFYQCNTIKDFLILWSQFYENKSCISTYYGTFVNMKGDNPYASYNTGNKFKEITLKGIIPVNFQHTIPYEQKGYITAFAPLSIIRVLTKTLNRYDNIVAFHYDLTKKDNSAKDLYVTYNSNVMLSKEFNMMIGKPYTHVGGMDNVNDIQEWMNDNLQKLINDSTYGYLVIVDPSFQSSSEYILDVLLEVVEKLDYYLKDELFYAEENLKEAKEDLIDATEKEDIKYFKDGVNQVNQYINRLKNQIGRSYYL